VGALVEAGIDGARINCSHGTPREWKLWVEHLRAAAAEAGRPVAIVFDLQGPKIRLAEATQEREVRRGERLTLTEGEVASPDGLAVPHARILASMVPGRSEVVIGDGLPRFAVERVAGRGSARHAVLRCVRPGAVTSRKGALVTRGRPKSQPSLTDKDLADLKVARSCQADFVALSYVRSARDIAALRRHLAAARLPARVIAKIETIAAMEALAAITAASDAVMVARGDLGVEAGVAAVPMMQRAIVHESARQGRLSIMATQMIESMVASSQPTRAEATDIATAVIQGTSAMMLSAETAVGRFPIEAVRAMAEIAYAAEGQGTTAPPPRAPSSDQESVMHAAAALGESVGAAAYVVPTASGGAARALAMYRPAAPIVALAHAEPAARQLALEWGVVPTLLPATTSLESMIEAAVTRTLELVPIPAGAPVVVTSGRSVDAPASTSLIALRRVVRRARKPGPA